MNRPNGWKPNPQAMASTSTRDQYGGSTLLQSSAPDTDCWLTPRHILRELGEFDLDPCAAGENPGWTGARFVFTADMDGLQQPWPSSARVFMNPPFSNTTPWLVKHSNHGIGISLIPASVESRVWRSHVWPKAKAVLLLHGRTRFCNPDGTNTTGRPLRSIALIAWNDVDATVLRNSQLAGVLLENWAQK